MLLCARGQLEMVVLVSGTWRMFLSNNRQLLMLSHCSRLIFEYFSTTYFMWSTTALVLLLSMNASLLVVRSLFNSKIVCLPTSVLDIRSMERRYSTGIVRLTNILIVVSMILVASVIFVSSLTYNRRGMRSFLMFWPNPMARRNVRSVQSSEARFLKISSKIAK